MTSLTAARPLEEGVAPDRRAQILDAAERCFTRAGFHRSTMQEIALEAGMSPGNLYRYFPSKDAMVAGLTERNRAQLRAEFARLSDAPDFMSAFAALGRKYFKDDPREKNMLCLEIWAEATHNPQFEAMHAAFARDCAASMVAAFQQAQARGQIPPTVDIEAVSLVTSLLADGLTVRRALQADFDPERDVNAALRVIGRLLRGDINFTPAPDAPGIPAPGIAPKVTP